VEDVAPRRWRSLTWRLAAAYSLGTLLIVATLGVAVHSLTAYYLFERLDSELEAQADFHAAYAAQLARDETTLAAVAPTIVGLFAPHSEVDVRFFAAGNGALLAATQDMGLQPSQAAFMQLRYRSLGVFTPPSLDLANRRYAAVPVFAGEQVIGVVEVSRSTLSILEFLGTLRQILLAVAAGAVVLSFVIGVLLARQVSRPVLSMEQATRRMADGDLAVRLRDYPSNELGRLSESINWMAERLESLEEARAQLISEISHDLRTPLTAIKGLLVNLIDDAEPQNRSSLELAEQETDRLIRLVNQLLDYSRWRGGRLTLDLAPTNVAEVGSRAVEVSRPAAEHRGLTLEANIPSGLPTINADSDRLQRVVFNLLDNAIKFTPSGGEVTLTVAQDGDEVRVSVEDTGRGMTAQELEEAVQPGLPGRDRRSGLGLSIARVIVEAHGGRMGAESSPGEGSVVWFVLPCNSCSSLYNDEVTS
jgi:signal transduction histidine kinase